MQTEFVAQEVRLTSIIPNPNNPRKTFDERKLEELAATIARNGVLQPVLLRPHPTMPNAYDLVAGERRVRASVIAQKKTIPAVIRAMSDDEVREFQQIENLQRDDLNPLEEARGYQELMDSNPDLYTVETLATRLGKEQKHIWKTRQLLTLTENAQALLLACKLPVEHAYELCRIQPPQQEEALNACFRQRPIAELLKQPHHTPSMSLRDLRQWIRDKCLLDLKNAPFDTKDANLVSAAGACSTCPKRAGANPALFSDIAKGQTCTDVTCFQTKKQALVQIMVDALKEKGFTAARITDDFFSDDKDVLTRNQYKLSKREACPDTQPAVYVEGRDFAKTVQICANSDCKVHAPQSRYSDAKAAQERKAELLEQRIEKQYRMELMRGLQSKLPKVPKLADLQHIANRVFQLVGNDNRRRVVRTYQWEEKKKGATHGGQYLDSEATAASHVAKMGSTDIYQFLLVCILSGDLYVPGYNPNEKLTADSQLCRIAKAHGLDPKAIRKKVEASMTSKGK